MVTPGGTKRSLHTMSLRQNRLWLHMTLLQLLKLRDYLDTENGDEEQVIEQSSQNQKPRKLFPPNTLRTVHNRVVESPVFDEIVYQISLEKVINNQFALRSLCGTSQRCATMSSVYFGCSWTGLTSPSPNQHEPAWNGVY